MLARFGTVIAFPHRKKNDAFMDEKCNAMEKGRVNVQLSEIIGYF